MAEMLNIDKMREMEALLGALIDHCDNKQQRLLLNLHKQLQSIHLSQSDDQMRLKQLRAAAQSTAQILR